MSDHDLLDLKDLVIATCDDLYKHRKLITKKVVIAIAQEIAQWSEAALELYVPNYINEWRLQNLAEDQSIIYAERIQTLESQVSKYRAGLLQAQKTINKLKLDLNEANHRIRKQREQIVSDLRGLFK